MHPWLNHLIPKNHTTTQNHQTLPIPNQTQNTTITQTSSHKHPTKHPSAKPDDPKPPMPTPTPTTHNTSAKSQGQWTKKGRTSQAKNANKEMSIPKNQRRLTDFLVRPKPPPETSPLHQGLSSLKQPETTKSTAVQTRTKKFCIPPKPPQETNLPLPTSFKNVSSETTPLSGKKRRTGQNLNGDKSISCQGKEYNKMRIFFVNIDQ